MPLTSLSLSHIYTLSLTLTHSLSLSLSLSDTHTHTHISGVEVRSKVAEDDKEEETMAERNEDIVEVYAERLSAVTHAFALCCRTLQQASGRSEQHSLCSFQNYSAYGSV